ncbi:hypothetical protein KI387_013219 [Taxus chinensis]|uniref:Oxidoreductase FAD/NAD(P)-binding domain-containing protein n=1 Tax=Taxus chinensis TaxID=29808 RepID=A0AA38CKT3_TAXCH|nr:hypothetical protein KI387_013219 [Taxus chinensis]
MSSAVTSMRCLTLPTHFHPSSRSSSRLGGVRCEFRVSEIAAVAREEFYAAPVLDIEDVARGIRCVTVEAQISRELVHREDAYTRPGQLARVRVKGNVYRVPVCSPPFSKETNWSVLYKMRGDMPSGAVKAPNSTLSVKAPLQLHVVSEEEEEACLLASVGQVIELGPFEGASGIDLRPVLFISGFPTLLMFASGTGIAVARAIIEANEGDAGSLSLSFRHQVRLYYSAPDPTLIAYKSRFGEWEKRKVKTRSTVCSRRGGEDWDGFVGSFSELWEEDDIEYDPHTTAVVVCAEEQSAIAEIKDLLSRAEIPDKQVIYWNAAAL